MLHTYLGANNTPKGSISTLEHDSPNFAIESVKIVRKFKKHSVLSRVFSDHAYGSAVSARVRQFKPDIVMSANTPLDAQKLLVQAAHNADATTFLCDG